MTNPMAALTRVTLSLIILPMLYFSGVRLVSQFVVSTDRSTLFRTTLGDLLSAPHAVDLGAAGPEPADSRLPEGTSAFKASGSELKILAFLDPFNSDYRYLSARALIRYDLNRAEAAVRQGIRLSAIDPKNWLLLGWIKGREGSGEHAYAAFDKALMLDPKRPDSFAQQGLYLHRLWLTAEGPERTFFNDMAFLSLRRALELDGRLYADPQLNTALASLYRSAGQPGYAISILTRVPDNSPMSWPVALERMSLFFSLGERVKALSEWKKFFNAHALSRDELEYLESEIGRYETPEFAYFLARIHMTRNKHDQALEELKELVSKKGEVAEYKVALASAYEHRGNHREASRLYEDALRLSPANQEAKKKVMEYYGKPVGK